jgi:hypothetical protein
VRVPEASSARPLFTWGLHVALKGAPAPGRDAHRSSPPRLSHPPAPLGSRGELHLPGRPRVPQGFIHPPPPYPQLADSLLRSPEPPLAGTGSRGDHLPWPPACPPHRPLLAPNQATNRTLVTPSPSSRTSPAKLR